MARKKREEIQERDITGLKYFDKLAPLLERLHDDGCLRDKAGQGGTVTAIASRICPGCRA